MATPPASTGLRLIEDERARQHRDALASFASAGAGAGRMAKSLRRTGRLLLLGMGGSHAASRAVEPLYRDLGIDAVAIPLSEQLNQPLPLAGRTVIVTSQSGESAEIHRWLDETASDADVFGLTMDGASSLARRLPCLVGAGGVETGFAATRSLMVTLALHGAVLAAVGANPARMLAALSVTDTPDVGPALAAMRDVNTVVATARRLQGLAESLALGLTELSRVPCLALESGQMRHGMLEMLGPRTGVLLLRAQDGTADLVGRFAEVVARTGAPAVVFDASGKAPVPGVVSVRLPPAEGMAALLSMLPTIQGFMLGFAASRVPEVGAAKWTEKVTRQE